MLKAFGIHCVFAPGFGQIFYDNGPRNHMLPLRLDAAAGTLAAENGPSFGFELPALRPSGATYC